MFKKDVIESYDVLVEKQQKLQDEMSNLGREKDYKVQKIEKQYDSEIENLIRKVKAIDLKIEIAKKYVNGVSAPKAELIKKIRED